MGSQRPRSSVLDRAMSWTVRRVGAASPRSPVGRLRDRLRDALRTRRLDAENRDEFEDVSEHERMLADSVRVDTYERAIDRYIGASDVVLDLGAGTGILSFLAARRARRVYAVEHSGIIDIARKIGDANGFTNITYIRANSRDFTPPEPIDVVLHEQIGDQLFEENMVANVVDLRDRVLRSGGRILPSKFALYFEPVQLRDDYSVPFIWQLDVAGLDWSFLEHDPQVRTLPRRWDVYWQHRLEVDHLLCEPSPLVELDLMTVGVDDLPRSVSADKQVTAGGRFDGLFVYLAIAFDDEIRLETSPSTRTSWGNLLLRVPPTQLVAGDEIAFTVEMPEATQWTTWKLKVYRPFAFPRSQ